MSDKVGKAGIGHPDPNHPSNRYVGDEKKLVDWTGRPVVHTAPWGSQGTNLWLFLTSSKIAPGFKEGVDGALEPSVSRLHQGGVWFALGCTEGRPVSNVATFGSALELPADLARDELKKQYVIDWLRDTAFEVMEHAVAELEFKGLKNADEFATWLADAAETNIRRMGL